MNVADSPDSMSVPSAAAASRLTLTPTPAPAANRTAGVKTSTVLPSAQVILPGTRLPATITEKALAVTARFIAELNRTETAVAGTTSVAPLAGRNRTTLVASTVVTLSGAGATTGWPSASTTVPDRLTV